MCQLLTYPIKLFTLLYNLSSSFSHGDWVGLWAVQIQKADFDFYLDITKLHQNIVELSQNVLQIYQNVLQFNHNVL